ncbi:JmjC domain-containing histone demethylation protein 1 [Actinomortierella ambigua]|nr:JmjC domain-containing histone demethylation protein 1 [Actinomortierella ambigua]
MEVDDQETCILCPEDGLGNIEATWICCDACNEWYHIRCIKMPLDEFETVDKYHCQRCQDTKRAGPTTYVRKSSRKTGRVNYADLQNGHVNTESKWKVILDSQRYLPDKFERIQGNQVTLERLRATGFTSPLIIKKGDQDYSSVDRNGLEMQMPPSTYTVADVRDAVGKDTPVEVIDVATQSEVPGYDMERWADYFGSEHKERIYNVISLEISDTDLADQVVRPRIVRELDWVENYWPTDHTEEDFPKVQLYCLMSVAGSFTDFHIDFAGSSVYYHILSGSKTFYFVEPTPSNLKKYTRWSNSADQASTFFASEVNGKCYKVELEQGDTMLIPTGWIHSVYTPKDSIVIGGNFLHSLNIPMQYNVTAIEDATNVPRKFRFPYFHKMNWFVALGYIKGGQGNLARVSTMELHGIIALTLYLNQKRVEAKTDPKLTKEERHALRASVPTGASQFATGGCMGLLRELNSWCFDALQSRGEAVDDSKRLATMADQENSSASPQQGSTPPKIKLRLKIKSTSSTTSAHSDEDDRNSTLEEQRVPVADPNMTSPITSHAPVKAESPTTTTIKPGKLTIKLKPSPQETSTKRKQTTHHVAEDSDESDLQDDDEDEWDDLERAIQGSDDEFDPLGDDDEIKAEEEDFMHSSDSEYDEGRSSSKRSTATSGRSRKRSRTSASNGSSPSSQTSASAKAYSPKHKKTASLDAGTRLAQLGAMATNHAPPAQRAQAETVFFGDDETGADPLGNGGESEDGDSGDNKGAADLGRKRKVHGGATEGHFSKGANANYNRSILSSYNTPDSKKAKKVVGQTARERLANKLLRR